MNDRNGNRVARFEYGDKVRPIRGIRRGEMGTIKEIHGMVLTPNSEVTYKVRFDVVTQFGYSDYEYGCYQESELQPVVVGQMGFTMEDKCATQQ